MAADQGIATRLRRDGLKVREVAGWETRGRDFAGTSPTFNPSGGVNHHTAVAGTKDNPAPSLRIVRDGRSDLIGPLANVMFAPLNQTFYVVAAGTCNHAGLPDGGVCRGMHGNSDAYGLEVEWAGTSPLPAASVALLARAWAAILRGRDIPASQLVQHWEWAPSRKIDLATNMHGADAPAPSAGDFRGMVAKQIKLRGTVTLWTVHHRAADGSRVEGTTKDPTVWPKNHKAAYQRGGVRFDPKRRG